MFAHHCANCHVHCGCCWFATRLLDTPTTVGFLFSWMRSEGFSFYFGGLGFCDRNRSQPSASVRHAVAMAVPMASFAKVVTLQTSRSLVSRGRRGTLWCNVSKVVLCARRNTFASSFCVAGAALQMYRIACFLRIALSGLREEVTRCKFRGRRGILWHVMEIDGCLARNIDFEVVNFEVHEKTRRKMSILKLRTVKMWGSLARNARLEAPTCFVWILWSCSAIAVSMGKLQNFSFS